MKEVYVKESFVEVCVCVCKLVCERNACDVCDKVACERVVCVKKL